jgi:hypothetical protein
VARETIYLVQAYKPGKGTRLNAEPAIRCKSSEGARKTAEGLALTRAGVVAFATSGDSELGEYDDEPTIIFKAGRLPAPFAEGEANAGVVAGLRQAIAGLWGRSAPIFPAQPCSSSSTGACSGGRDDWCRDRRQFRLHVFRGARFGKSVFWPAAGHRVVAG